LTQKHEENVKTLADQHGARLEELTSQWKACLTERAEQSNKLNEELIECCEQEDRAATECLNEYITLYDFVLKTAKVIADVEDGNHPVVKANGVRRAVLSAGCAPELPEMQNLPSLSSALDRTSNKKEQESKRRVNDVYSAAGSDGGTPIGSARESLELDRTWDAARAAKEICDAADDAACDKLLRSFTTERLRSLCVELRHHALEVFSPRSERESLRQDATAGLTNEATRRYIQDLEVRRNSARSSLADAVDRARQLRHELEGRRGALLGVRSLTPGAAFPTSGSRSSSRPRTPNSASTRAGSRQSSRPTTATQSRPPTAMSYGQAAARMSK